MSEGLQNFKKQQPIRQHGVGNKEKGESPEPRWSWRTANMGWAGIWQLSSGKNRSLTVVLRSS